MKCNEFQRIIPEIINNSVPDDMLEQVINHVESCRDCYDELEIHYVLQYGLDESAQKQSFNFIGQLEDKLMDMKCRNLRYKNIKASYYLTQITAHTAVAGALIYVVFKYFI